MRRLSEPPLFYAILAERTGLAYMLQAADFPTGKSLLVQAMLPAKGAFLLLYSGGADGTRTRDPRRDRPVF